MPFCETRSGVRPVMSSSPKRIRPAVGRSTPVRQLNNVLFPAPFGPMTARNSPRPSSKLTPFKAVRPPKRTVRSSARRTGAAVPRPLSAEGRLSGKEPTINLRGHLAHRRIDGLVGRYRLEEMIFAAVDLVDELRHERLMVFFAEEFVALREIVPRLHFQAFERRNQLVRVLAAREP